MGSELSDERPLAPKLLTFGQRTRPFLDGRFRAADDMWSNGSFPAALQAPRQAADW